MIDSMIGQVRDISLALRPPLLDQAGLVPALEQFLDTLADRTGIGIELDASPEISPESPAVRITLFRVVQEAVSNALRHAGARRILVSLHEEGNGIRLRVEDDGVGFDPGSVGELTRRGEHLGIVGMAERVRGVGGRFSVRADQSSGSCIDAWVPARDPNEGAEE
jgi:signal transduction histidine kinase